MENKSYKIWIFKWILIYVFIFISIWSFWFLFVKDYVNFWKLFLPSLFWIILVFNHTELRKRDLWIQNNFIFYITFIFWIFLFYFMVLFSFFIENYDYYKVIILPFFVYFLYFFGKWIIYSIKNKNFSVFIFIIILVVFIFWLRFLSIKFDLRNVLNNAKYTFEDRKMFFIKELEKNIWEKNIKIDEKTILWRNWLYSFNWKWYLTSDYKYSLKKEEVKFDEKEIIEESKKYSKDEILENYKNILKKSGKETFLKATKSIIEFELWYEYNFYDINNKKLFQFKIETEEVKELLESIK